MAWIRDRVNPDAPDEAHTVVGIDCGERSEIGERVVSQLLNSAMEGDEGVFYLLPHDLCYEVTRSGGVVTVDLLTTLTMLTSKSTLDGADRERAIAAGLISHHEQSRETADDAPGDDDAPIEWVTVLSATIPFPEDATLPGPPIVLIDHEGVVGLDELVAAIPETGVHIVGPKPDA
jgi:hypothetical protein